MPRPRLARLSRQSTLNAPYLSISRLTSSDDASGRFHRRAEPSTPATTSSRSCAHCSRYENLVGRQNRVVGRSGCQNEILPLSSLPQISNDIIQKGLAFVREQSGSVTVPGATRPRDPAPPAAWPRWGCGGGGNDARILPPAQFCPRAVAADQQVKQDISSRLKPSGVGGAVLPRSSEPHLSCFQPRLRNLARD